MKLYLGADHRGFDLKYKISAWLTGLGSTFEDLGAHTLDPEDDYNEVAIAVSRAVKSNPESFGILICGSAQGMAMQANRIKGIRAAICHVPEEARIAREHNNANILCLSADRPEDPAQEIISKFTATPYQPTARFDRRNQKLDQEIA